MHLLLGNLESGWMGDARFARRVTVRLPRARLGLPDGDLVAVSVNREAPDVRPDSEPSAEVVLFTLTVAPAGCLVVRIEPPGDVA